MMTSEAKWNELREERELAYLRGDLATSSPQSYSLEEKRQICEDMEASTAAVDDALRKDFASMPPIAQGKMLDLLQKADPDNFDWWEELLLGRVPNSPGEIQPESRDSQ